MKDDSKDKKDFKIKKNLSVSIANYSDINGD